MRVGLSARKASMAYVLATTVVLAWTAVPAQAYYVERLLAEVIAEADVIVVGTIRDVKAGKDVFPADHYQKGSTLYRTSCLAVSVERVVKGTGIANGDVLPVDGFVDWSCASRWARYAPGQRAVLFLHTPPTDCEACAKPTWRVVGAGNEGEVPLDDQFAYFHAGEDGLSQKQFDVAGGQFFGRRAPVASFLEAVTDFQRLFDWTFQHPKWPTIRQVATDAEVAAYEGRSPLHARLVRQVRQYRALKINLG